MKKKKWLALCLSGMMALSMTACGGARNIAAAEVEEEAGTTLEKIDMTKWQYNEDDDVYYQTGIAAFAKRDRTGRASAEADQGVECGDGGENRAGQRDGSQLETVAAAGLGPDPGTC